MLVVVFMDSLMRQNGQAMTKNLERRLTEKVVCSKSTSIILRYSRRWEIWRSERLLYTLVS